ncbi:MAG: site-2 protease family protein [Candidatus Saccharibacteria bacterium]|nr:site-2 protease family protein [Candidatus Saccharibacteria bacterium]
MNIAEILIVFGIILFSMVLHEMAHAYVAYFLGDTTAKDEGRLSPNPLVHIDPWMSIVVPLMLFISGGPIFGGAKPVPINSRNLKGGAFGMALVALAGPAMNFIIAFVGFMIGHFTGGIYTTGLVQTFYLELVLANLGFMVFNLLPIPPLDGSRVLYAIAPDGIREVMERMEQTIGIILVLILVVFFGTYLSQFASNIVMNILYFFISLVS